MLPAVLTYGFGDTTLTSRSNVLPLPERLLTRNATQVGDVTTRVWVSVMPTALLFWVASVLSATLRIWIEVSNSVGETVMVIRSAAPARTKNRRLAPLATVSPF